MEDIVLTVLWINLARAGREFRQRFPGEKFRFGDKPFCKFVSLCQDPDKASQDQES